MKCLIDCLSAWLEKKDGVKNKGFPSWLTLVMALEELEKRTAASVTLLWLLFWVWTLLIVVCVTLC